MENRIKPKPYPQTDTPECEGVLLFKNCLNLAHVKTDIRERDKLPNVDGTIELVDGEGSPIGKFDVQVRKIPRGDIKYSCPVSLVAYSLKSTLPVLLICSDVEDKIVYWKHIHNLMPEYKMGTKTFTVHFNENNIIDKNESYIDQWRVILNDYQQRIIEYPKLKNLVDDNLLLNQIDQQDLIYFQTYIKEINLLLDRDFTCIKELFFPDILKLGVGIYDCSKDKITYQLHKIDIGETRPSVCVVKEDPMKALMRKRESDAFYACFSPRKDDPKTRAKEFIYGYLEKAFKKRLFSMHGEYLSAEMLYAFLDKYHKILGIEKSTEYEISQLEKGVYQYLPQAIAAFMYGSEGAREVHVDIDHFNRFCIELKTFPPNMKQSDIRLVFSNNRFLLKHIRESIEYLRSKSITKIYSPLKYSNSQDKPKHRRPFYIYDRETEIYNIKMILSNLLSEYEIFVKGNKLQLNDSPYLNNDTAIVFCYKPIAEENFGMPILSEMHFDNKDNVLDRLTTMVGENAYEDSHEIAQKFNRPPTFISTGIVDFLPKEELFLNFIYRLLGNDLEKHYNMRVY